MRKIDPKNIWGKVSKRIHEKIDCGSLFALRDHLKKKTDLMLKTKDGALKIDQIQVEGKKVVSADNYICGCHDLKKIDI